MGPWGGAVIQVLGRFHRILLHAAGDPDQSFSIGDLAASAGVSSQTCLHIVKTMVALGYLSVEGSGYRMGPLPASLSREDAPLADLKKIAAPLLDELTAETRETSLLVTRIGFERTVLLWCESDRDLVVKREASRIPELHTTPTGLVILSGLSDKERSHYFASTQGGGLLPKSEKEKEKILKKIRAEGEFLLIPGVSDPDGVAVMAFAILRGETVVAALGMKVPAVRMSAARQKEIVSHARKCAEEINRRLSVTEKLPANSPIQKTKSP